MPTAFLLEKITPSDFRPEERTDSTTADVNRGASH